MLRSRTRLAAWVLSLPLAVAAGGAFGALNAAADVAEILPIAKYEFNDENDFGKDSMGHYDMEYRNKFVSGETGDLLDGASKDAAGGIAFAREPGLCLAQDEDSNMFADVTAFTLCFEIKTVGAADWQHFIGVGDGNGKDEFAFVGRASGSVGGQMRLIMHDVTPKSVEGVTSVYYSAPKIFDGADKTEFQNVIVSVQPGGELAVYVNGEEVTLQKYNASGGSATNMETNVPEDWTAGRGSQHFSIGAPANNNTGTGSKCSSGSVRNVAFYDFAMDQTCAEAYNANGKVTQDDVSNLPCITSLALTEDGFEDGTPTKNTLYSHMTTEEMFTELNVAGASVTLSKGTTDKTAPVEWKSIEKSGETYTAKGVAHTSALGYPLLCSANVEYELEVANVESVGEPVFAGDVAKTVLLDTMTDGELLAQINKATVTVSLGGGREESVEVTFTRIVREGGKVYAAGDVIYAEQTVGTARVLLTIQATENGPGRELLPVARYTFDSEETKCTDSAGNYDLQAANAPGTADQLATGTVQEKDGASALYLDGNSILACSQLNDIGDHVNHGFTLAFRMWQDGKIARSSGEQGFWHAPVSFGAADFGKTDVGAGFLVGSDSLNVKVDAHQITKNVNSGNFEYDHYYTQNVLEGNADSGWHTLVMTVRPGETFKVFADGTEVFSEACPADWNLNIPQMTFAIGGRCIWNNGYNLWKGWIDDVSIYNFAITLEQSQALWTNGKLTVGDMDGKVITSIDETPVFENGQVASGKLTDKLSSTQVSRRVNKATVNAVFGNEETVALPVDWTGYGREEGKWYLYGEVDASDIGYATLITGKTEIKVELEVERAVRTVTVDQPKNGTLSADKTEVYLDDVITITAEPSEGYETDRVTVNGEAVEKNAEGKYVYTVTGIEDIEIAATFREVSSDNEETGAKKKGCGSALGAGAALSAVLLAGVSLAAAKKKGGRK